MKQESPVARTEELPEKRSAREKAKRRGNAKEERVHFGLIDGASDSVGNHVGMRINKARGEPGFSWLFRRSAHTSPRLYIRQVDGRHNSKYFSRLMVMKHFACASSAK